MNEMKKQHFYWLIIVVLLLVCSCKNREVDFSYSPTEPRAGEKITFSNLTAEGENWVWKFGDGSQSTSKNPTKVYKKPGTYTVTLTADSSRHRICAKEITVFDTVPTFSVSTDSVVYREELTLQAVLYNPYSKSVTYQWELPECAVVTKGAVSESSVQIYFLTKDTTVQIRLVVTLDKKEFVSEQSLYIHDGEAISLLMATESGIMRQRLFDNGIEAPTILPIEMIGKGDVGVLLTNENELYILEATSGVERGIYRYNLQDGQLSALVKNSEGTKDKGFNSGFLDKQYLYWGTLDAICRVALTEENVVLQDSADHLAVSVSDITSMERGTSVGVSRVGTTYFWSTGKGIYHFNEDKSMIAALVPTSAITFFTADIIARKVYFVAGNTLCVCNFDGSYLTELSKDATGTATISYGTNHMYFTTTEGVAYMPLIQTQNNRTTATPTLLNDITGIAALAIDETKR